MARVAGRASLAIPAVLAILALKMRWPQARLDRIGAAFALGLVALCEVWTSTILYPTERIAAYTPELARYLDTIGSSRGEALLDWPICIFAGNGAHGAMCPTGFGHYGLQRFHHKKTPDVFLGRMTPELLSTHLSSGWDYLLGPNPRRAPGDCFTEQEWRFFREFYLANDFAGIQLHPDLVGAACRTRFREAFGPPTAEATLPEGGSGIFFRKHPTDWKWLDPARGKSLVFHNNLDGQIADLVGDRPYGIRHAGLGGTSRDGDRMLRDINAKRAVVRFTLQHSQPVRLELGVGSVFRDQELSLSAQGVPLGRLAASRDHSGHLSTVFLAQAGENAITLDLTIAGRSVDCLLDYLRGNGFGAWTDLAAIRRFERQNNHRPAQLSQFRITPLGADSTVAN